MARRRRRRLACAAGLAALAAAFLFSPSRPSPRPPRKSGLQTVAVASNVLVTAYCNCGACCGWRRSWFGLGPPVQASGKGKGRRKRVGVTASGALARRGTVAADPSLFPFGTELEIPGYGRGVVEDTGSAIKGLHLDVWFPSHARARAWGRRRLNVRVLR